MSTINSTSNEVSNYNRTQSKEADPVKKENDITTGDSTYKASTYSPSKDIVEISQDGRRALENYPSKGIEKNEAGATSSQSTANSAAIPKNLKNAAEGSSNTDNESEDEEVSTTELYTMSDSQLLKKLNNGSITQSEYDNEIARRSRSSTKSDEDDLSS